MIPTLALLALPADVVPHRAAPVSSLLHAEVRPLGFSPQGHFAMLYVAPDEAVGCAQWRVSVVNLRTDDVAETLSSAPDVCDATAVDGWVREQPAIQDLLIRHGVLVEELPLQTFPVTHLDDQLDARLRTRPIEPIEGGDAGRRAPVDVVLRSREHGEKTLGTLAVIEQWEMPMAWGHEVLGYLPSPHEPRVAVLVREEHRGWEGLPAVETVHVMGASLDAGFRK